MTFLKAHWGAIAAMDFFTVEVLTWHGLVRYFVLFAIDLKTRRVHIAGIVHEAYGQWMEHGARKDLTDPVEGFLRSKRYLIHDRVRYSHVDSWAQWKPLTLLCWPPTRLGSDC